MNVEQKHSFLARRGSLIGLSVFLPLALLAVMLFSANFVQAQQPPPATIVGVVVNPDNSLINDATSVMLYALNKEGSQVWEASKDVMAGDGHFSFDLSTIPPEAIREKLFVQADGYADYFDSAAQPVNLQDLTKLDIGKVKLTYASFKGQVFNQNGQIVTDCLEIVLEDDRGDWVASTEYCGSMRIYQLGGVPTGNYRLTAMAPKDSLLWNSDPVSVSVVAGSQYDPAQTQTKDFKLQTPNLLGKVTYPDGSPVNWVPSATGEIVGRAIVYATNYDWSIENHRSTTKAGDFGLKLPPGGYRLWAEVEGTLAEKFTPSIPQNIKFVDIGRATPLTLTYPSLTGWLNSPSGQRITTCLHVWLEEASSFSNSEVARTRYCGNNGPYRLGGVPDGTYWLKSEGLAERGLAAPEPIMVTVLPGSQYQDKPQQLDLVLQKSDFVGEVRFPLAAFCPNCPVGADIRLRNADWSMENWLSSGKFALSNLVTGTYILEFFLNEDLSMDWNPPNPFTLTWPTTQISKTFYLQPALRTKKVEGKVAYQDGTIITTARVYAYQDGLGRWLEYPIKPDGTFAFYLSSGVWKMGVSPEFDADWYFTREQEQWVEFLLAPDQMETKTVNFTVTKANFLNVTGQVKDPHGNPPPRDTVGLNLCTDEGVCFDARVDEKGNFRAKVTVGTYHVWVWVDPASRLAPPSDELTIKVNADLDLGIIPLHSESERTAQISGRVVVTPTGEGLPGVTIQVQSGKQGWDSTTTITDGQYALNLMPGRWNAGPILSAEQEVTYTVLQRQHREGDLKPGEKLTGIDFYVVKRDATIQGRVVDAAGNMVSDITAKVYAEICSANGKCWNVDEGSVQGGSFELRVLGGQTYNVGIWLADGAYMSASSIKVAVEANQTKTGVQIQLLTAGTTIFGNLQDEQGQPVKVNASVYGSLGDYWVEDTLWPEKEPYQYKLQVPTPAQNTKWTLGLWVDPRSGYVADPTRTSYEVSVGAGITQVQQIMVVKRLSETIKGKIVMTDTSKTMAHLLVIAEGKPGTPSEGLYFEGESNAQGEFAIPVMPGQYLVGMPMPKDENFAGMFQPERKTWTSMQDNPLMLAFRSQEMKMMTPDQIPQIVGNLTVTPTDSLAKDAEISIFGWSEEGDSSEITGTLASGFKLTVISRTTWHIWAAYEDTNNDIYYESQEKVVRVGTGPITVNLVLKKSTDATLPDTTCETFDSTQFKRISLPAYGNLPAPLIEVPAGTMPVTGTVQLCATPKKALPNGQNVIGFGYDLEVRDSEGNLIKQNFNKKVRLIFYFPQGTKTKNLQVAYYSDTRQKWVALDDLFIDTEDMFATGKINHFTRMGIASVPDTSSSNSNVYLPLIMK